MKKSNMGFLCGQGWEEALVGELNAISSECRPNSVAPGFVVCAESPEVRREVPVFARQWLPGIQEVSGESVRVIAQRVGEIADSFIDPVSLPWTFASFTPDLFTEDSERYRKIGARATLIEKTFFERMEKFRKRAMERFIPWGDVEEKRSMLVLQCLLVKSDRLWISGGETMRISPHRVTPLLWKDSPGQVSTDPAAPCRSYYKLEEAWKQSGMYPKAGESCVDLGAAPGGWTWAALKRGTKVVAVDAADLSPRVEKHPDCTHLPDNGYSYMPDKPVDWMFCDMIVRPLATLGLVERWLEAGMCKKFVVNLKFRGKDPSSILKAIGEFQLKWNLAALTVRHLYYDRNEITLIGRR